MLLTPHAIILISLASADQGHHICFVCRGCQTLDPLMAIWQWIHIGSKTVLKYFWGGSLYFFQILPFTYTYPRPGLQRSDLDDRFWGRTGYVPSNDDVVLRTGSLVFCWWSKLATPCSITFFFYDQEIMHKGGHPKNTFIGVCFYRRQLYFSQMRIIIFGGTKQWMSDSDDKWLGKPMLFLPANEAAAIQQQSPPGLPVVNRQRFDISVIGSM